jgi:hypothetical protein
MWKKKQRVCCDEDDENSKFVDETRARQNLKCFLDLVLNTGYEKVTESICTNISFCNVYKDTKSIWHIRNCQCFFVTNC